MNDAAIPQEHVERVDDTTIRIDDRTGAGDNVRAVGKDIGAGKMVLVRGGRIKAADLGFL